MSRISADIKAGIVRRFVQILVLFSGLATILFVSSGRLNWLWAWTYLGLYIAATAINSVVLFRRSPETIAERGKTKIEHQWEKVIGGLWAASYFIAIPLVSGLTLRFAWPPELPVLLQMMSAALFAAGLALFGWALAENAFFITSSRIQDERNQTVCQTGPYRVVRHPGYLGAVMQGLAVPVMLGSLWALIPGVLSIALMMVRTHYEDRMLRQELAGYGGYARNVLYRIIPGVW